MTTSVSITIVFTDLVDSTAIETRLGPDAADRLRQVHFGLLRAAMSGAGGAEVKTTGDGLMLAFPSLSSALAGSVAAQQALERHNRKATEPLRVRIGVSHGEAELVEGDYYGPPAIEAARLCAAADGGQILTTELARLMVGNRGGLEFASLGERELKGFPEPVPVCEILWQPLAGPAVQGRLGQAPAVAFYGRSQHVARLEAARKEAGEGNPRLALLAGEAGMGKTRLATELARRANHEGEIVIYGRCEEELGAAYQPWIEALDHLVATVPERVVTDHVARHGGEVARLVPRLAERAPGLPEPTRSDPEAERYLLFGAVVGLLARAAEEAPVLLVLDDLHWADKPSLLLLRYLIGARTAARLLVVGTYRDTDLSGSHPLLAVLADLRREPGVERLHLRGLEDFELLALLEGLTGHELDEVGLELVQALNRETDGNPFFVLEILRHLGESGAVYQRGDGRWQFRRDLADVGVPQSIREVVRRRVDRLGEAATRVLSLAAVIGREFELDLLAAVATMGEDDLIDVLEEATAAGIVDEVPGAPGRYAFTHALIEHVLYDELSATRRQRAHLRTAEALEELDRGESSARRDGQLAHHWAQATRPTDTGKALEYARRAAENALAQLGPDEAVRWYAKALELLAQQTGHAEAVRAELMVGLGTAQRQAGDAAYRETLLEAARLCQGLGHHDLLVQAALANTRGQVSRVGDLDEERVAVLRAALDAVGPGDDPRRARLLALLACEVSFTADDREMRSLADEAVAMARRVGDPATLSFTLHASFSAILLPDTLAQRLVTSAENVALSARLGDPVARWCAAFDRVLTAMEAGDIDEVDRHLAVVSATAEETSEPGQRYFAASVRAGRLLVAGRHNEAEAVANELMDIGLRSGQPDTAALYGAVIFAVRRDQGRLDELVDLLGEAVVQYPSLAILRPTLALIHAELGRLDEASAILAQEAADGFARLPYNSGGWLSSLCTYAEVCAVVGAVEPARVLLDLIAPYADHVVCAGQFSSGSAQRYVALLAMVLGDHDRADAAFGAALAVNERIGAPVWAARTRLDWAAMLAAGGEHDRARTMVAEAAATAAAFGCTLLERRAAELARALA